MKFRVIVKNIKVEEVVGERVTVQVEVETKREIMEVVNSFKYLERYFSKESGRGTKNFECNKLDV